MHLNIERRKNHESKDNCKIYQHFGSRCHVVICVDPIMAGIIVTVLNTGAYMAETVRAGIKSIDIGQREGALALGMSPICFG